MADWSPDAEREEFQARTNRLYALAEFLHKPLNCRTIQGVANPDVLDAYDHAVEAALDAVRSIAMESVPAGRAASRRDA